MTFLDISYLFIFFSCIPIIYSYFLCSFVQHLLKQCNIQNRMFFLISWPEGLDILLDISYIYLDILLVKYISILHILLVKSKQFVNVRLVTLGAQPINVNFGLKQKNDSTRLERRLQAGK